MIDIHCHILPGVDDGPNAIEESLAMLRLAAASGTTEIISTPHANSAFPFDELRVRDTFETLCSSIDVPIRLYLGCELHLNYANLQRVLANPENYTLNSSRYLLLELPEFFSPPAVTRAIQELTHSHLTPVIAHAERNYVLKKDLGLAQRWRELGCLIQITSQSLLGSFGSSAKHAAEQFIESRIADIAASDAHDCNKRSPDQRVAYNQVAETYGAEFAQRLFVQNPAALVANSEVPRVAPQRHASSWFFRSGMSLLRSIKNAS